MQLKPRNATEDYKMTIKTTSFEHILHGHDIHKPCSNSDYVRHEIDVYNMVYGLYAVYQTGLSFLGNDYSRPDPSLQLSGDGGADERLVTVNLLSESELDALKDSDDLADFLDDLNIGGIDSWESLASLFYLLRDNEHSANLYLKSLGFSEYVEDYTRVDGEHYATLKVND